MYVYFFIMFNIASFIIHFHVSVYHVDVYYLYFVWVNWKFSFLFFLMTSGTYFYTKRQQKRHFYPIIYDVPLIKDINIFWFQYSSFFAIFFFASLFLILFLTYFFFCFLRNQIAKFWFYFYFLFIFFFLHILLFKFLKLCIYAYERNSMYLLTQRYTIVTHQLNFSLPFSLANMKFRLNKHNEIINRAFDYYSFNNSL